MAKRRKSSAGPTERRRRELKSYLDQLQRIRKPTQQDVDLMIELQQALKSMKSPVRRR